MVHRKAAALTALALLLSSMAGSPLAASPAADAPGSGGASSIAAPVTSGLTYQGQLTDAAGVPLSGTHNLTFQLWDDATAGSQLGPDIVRGNVAVNNGLFAVDLDVPDEAFDGAARWVRIAVNGQWLAPRQALAPAPYALTLRPGALITGHSAEPVRTLSVRNLGLAPALYVEGTAIGLHAAGLTAVKAVGPLGVLGSGVGEGSVGVRGMTTDGVGVEGMATVGRGVIGSGTGDGAVGVLGTVNGYASVGVRAESLYGTGLEAVGETGLRATGSVNFAVVAQGPMGIEAVGELGDGIAAATGGEEPAAAVRGSTTTDAYGGHFTSVAGIAVMGLGLEGVHGESTSDEGSGVHGLSPGTGVLGESVAGIGVHGRSTGGPGVLGTSADAVGVSAIAGDVPLVIMEDKHAMFAIGEDYGVTAYGGRMGGHFAGSTGLTAVGGAEGLGIHGRGTGALSEGVRGTSEAAAGVHGVASGSGAGAIGVWGETSGQYGLYTAQKVFAGAGCVGCTTALLAQNAGVGSLAAGDVVVVVGIAPPLSGHETPRLRVRRATGLEGGPRGVVQSSVTVATVVVGGGEATTAGRTVAVPAAGPGPVAAGRDLLVVLQGLARVRVDASAAAIGVGDSLVQEAGAVRALPAAERQTVPIGTALEALDTGTGLVWVLLAGN